ncbi:hypothetical protein EYF80_033107 [Liparis tanakae]|uniref:Uncharacterized protein n=1 Tax=Liparis tanakae TaxID=230148 RepID=A0A4Z2GTZ5_9TELE|nr:hypothetical protein EYF80_033107 [Liparis tanakae]
MPCRGPCLSPYDWNMIWNVSDSCSCRTTTERISSHIPPLSSLYTESKGPTGFPVLTCPELRLVTSLYRLMSSASPWSAPTPLSEEDEHREKVGLRKSSSTGVRKSSSTGLRKSSSTGLKKSSSTGLRKSSSTGLRKSSSTGLKKSSSTGLKKSSSTGLFHKQEPRLHVLDTDFRRVHDDRGDEVEEDVVAVGAARRVAEGHLQLIHGLQQETLALILKPLRVETPLTLDWAKAVKDATRASPSSVSAVFMDTLMMWIGFSLVFCGMRKKSTLPLTLNSSSWNRLEWASEKGVLSTTGSAKLLRTSSKCLKKKQKHINLIHTLIFTLCPRMQRRKREDQWNATMAPMRWQGGEKAPSRKSSLLSRLILQRLVPVTGTGTLRTTHSLSLSPEP